MKKLLNKKRSLHRQSIKFDLKMKLSTLLMFVAVFTLQANTTYSQKTKVSLDLINVPVGHVLEEIESKTEPGTRPPRTGTSRSAASQRGGPTSSRPSAP